MQSSIPCRALAVLLAILLCGIPQLMAQQVSTSATTPSPTTPVAQPSDPAQNVAPNQGAPNQGPNQDQPPAQPAPAKPESDQAMPAPVTNPQTGMQTPVPGNVTVDPTQAPLAPVPSDDNPATPSTGNDQNPKQNPNQAPNHSNQSELPNAPSTVQNSAQQPSTPPPPNPVGAATSEGAQTVGGGASKPAGTAIAPAKQNQTRSLLIKVGAILGAGAALGTVYALSRSTPSKPPGAQ